MKLNFNFNLKDLQGNPVTGQDSNAGKILGNFLASRNKGNSLKLWDWAQKVYTGAVLEIDKTDAEVLTSIIEETEGLPVITKAQLIDHIKSNKG